MTNTQRSYPTYVCSRTDADVDPDHHLWRNGRLWWIAVTIHFSNGTARRIRRSLGTPDVEAARRHRDHILAEIDRLPNASLSLRFARHVA